MRAALCRYRQGAGQHGSCTQLHGSYTGSYTHFAEGGISPQSKSMRVDTKRNHSADRSRKHRQPVSASQASRCSPRLHSNRATWTLTGRLPTASGAARCCSDTGMSARWVASNWLIGPDILAVCDRAMLLVQAHGKHMGLVWRRAATEQAAACACAISVPGASETWKSSDIQGFDPKKTPDMPAGAPLRDSRQYSTSSSYIPPPFSEIRVFENWRGSLPKKSAGLKNLAAAFLQDLVGAHD